MVSDVECLYEPSAFSFFCVTAEYIAFDYYRLIFPRNIFYINWITADRPAEYQISPDRPFVDAFSAALYC